MLVNRPGTVPPLLAVIAVTINLIAIDFSIFQAASVLSSDLSHGKSGLIMQAAARGQMGNKMAVGRSVSPKYQ